ncbi:MAG: PEP-CTERM sorting domain-containing protein [Sphingomonadales bacterium]|nr:PEP-CTERM sorting domain-containing protein [Sphingomonadales bacterium]
MAATVFTENFNGETPALSSPLAQFAVTGSVDVVAAANPYGITVPSPASGNVLDINGTGAAGLITSLASFAFNAGDIVTLAFDLGGSQRGDSGDTFNTSFLFGGTTAYSNLSGTGLYSGLNGSGSTLSLLESAFVPGTTPFTSSSIRFLAGNAGSLRFAFSSPSQDNIGPLLDNIGLNISAPVVTFEASAIPEPATWTMLLLGFGMAGATLRRRKDKPRVRFAFD